MKKSLLIFIEACCLCSFAAETLPPHHVAAESAREIPWNEICPVRGVFHLINSEQEPTQKTEVKLAWNRRMLWIRYVCREAFPEAVEDINYGKLIWQNDCVEFYIDTNLDRTGFVQIICDFQGQLQTCPWDSAFNPGKIRHSVARDGNAWTVLIGIPWEVLGINLRDNMLFRVSFARNRWAVNSEFSTWNQPVKSQKKPNGFGWLLLGISPEKAVENIVRDEKNDAEMLVYLRSKSKEMSARIDAFFKNAETLKNCTMESKELYELLDEHYRIFRNTDCRNPLYENKISELLKQ